MIMKYSFIAGSKERVVLALVMLCSASPALALDTSAYPVTDSDVFGSDSPVTVGFKFTAETAGTQYVLAAHTSAGDGYRYNNVLPTTLTVNPMISVDDNAGLYAYGPTLVFPTASIGYDLYATPNMRPYPVPKPETYALLLVGLGLIGFTLSNRKA